MQVLKVDSEITVLYKIIITVFFFYNYQNTPSFLAPLYTFCVFWTSTIVVVFIQHLEYPERRPVSPHVSWPPLLVTSDSPSSATPSNVLHLCSVTWLSHVVRALQGQQVFSWVTRTYMERHVCYTISYSKLACGIEKGGELEMGFGGTQNVSTWLSLLAPSSPFFFFLFLFRFYLAKEADGPNFKPKLLVGVPKVSQHDIDDWNLIDFGSINLHHSLSIALSRLQ